MARRNYLRITDESPGLFRAEFGDSWLKVTSCQRRLTFDSCNMTGPPMLSPNGAARLARWMAEAAKG